ncbi:MAG: hypothetical protein U0269_38380 [Polyangiales bacterium]
MSTRVALLALSVLSALYQWALVLACRRSVWAEVAIGLVFPAACALTGRLRFVDSRVAQLVFIETYFCVAAIASKLTVSASTTVTTAVGALFVGFFVMQCAGFLVAQRRRRSPHGAFQTLVLFTLIAHWWWGRPVASGVVDSSGRLLVFGVEAPLTVRLAYVLWVSNVLLVQTRTLPRLHQALVHAVSVALAFGSGEFFHARLVTACHLFVLDLLVNYSEGRDGARSAVVLSPTLLRLHERYGRRALSWIASIGIASIAAAQLAR